MSELYLMLLLFNGACSFSQRLGIIHENNILISIIAALNKFRNTSDHSAYRIVQSAFCGNKLCKGSDSDHLTDCKKCYIKVCEYTPSERKILTYKNKRKARIPLPFPMRNPNTRRR